MERGSDGEHLTIMNETPVYYKEAGSAQPVYKPLVRACDDPALNFERLRGRWTEPKVKAKESKKKLRGEIKPRRTLAELDPLE